MKWRYETVKTYEIDPVMAAVAALCMDPLTTPDSEDWTVLIDGDTAHVSAMREFGEGAGRRVEIRHGETPVAELRKLVEELPANHNLGLVSLLMPADAERSGATDVFVFLRREAKRRKFSLTTMVSPRPTAACVLSFKEQQQHLTGNIHVKAP